MLEALFARIASGFRTILSLATQLDMFTDHVDISQAFVQSELLPGDGHNENVCISSPPGYEEDSRHIPRLLKPLKQRKPRHSLKLGKERRESSKRNYYIISPRVIIKAIIIIMACRQPPVRGIRR